MRRRRVVGIVVVVLLVGIGVGSWYLWTNLVFGGETRALAGAVTLRVQDDVAPGDERVVKEALGLARRYGTDVLEVAGDAPVEVRLGRRTPCVAFGSTTSPTAVAERGRVCVNTRAPGWRAGVAEPPVALSVVVHEHFHTVQARLGCLPGPDAHEYNWWVEGSATWVGWEALVEAGRATEEAVDERMREWGGYDDDLGPLSSYETEMSGDPSYALAKRAVDDLVELGGGPRSLVEFCTAVGRGAEWTDAFEAAYGLSVPAFYDRFEQARQE